MKIQRPENAARSEGTRSEEPGEFDSAQGYGFDCQPFGIGVLAVTGIFEFQPVGSIGFQFAFCTRIRHGEYELVLVDGGLFSQ